MKTLFNFSPIAEIGSFRRNKRWMPFGMTNDEAEQPQIFLAGGRKKTAFP